MSPLSSAHRGERRTTDVAGGGVALRRILGHGAAHDVVELRRYIGRDLAHGRRWRMHMSPQLCQLGVALVRSRARKSLEQDATERINVGARAHNVAFDLLRRHVVDGSHPWPVFVRPLMDVACFVSPKSVR